MRWFKHMTASADDEKLSRLRDAFGLEGYGFWWNVVEIIAARTDENKQPSVTFSAKKWGRSLGISAKKFRTLAEFCAAIDLFFTATAADEITVSIPNIVKYRDEYSERKARKADRGRDEVPPSRARRPEAEKEAEAPPEPSGGGTDEAGAFGFCPPGEMGMAFRQFLDAYPAEHREPAGEAAAVWRRLAKVKKLPGLPRLLDGITAWESSAQWRKENGRYIPKAANFLRNGLWLSAPPPAEPDAPTRAQLDAEAARLIDFTAAEQPPSWRTPR